MRIDSISRHAIRRYRQRVTDHPGKARVALFRMWLLGRNATNWELDHHRVPRRARTAYRITENYYGRFIMIARDNKIITVLRLRD